MPAPPTRTAPGQPAPVSYTHLDVYKRQLLEGWDIELIKNIKQKLSVKIFLITFVLLGMACSGTYFCISKLLPTTYTKLLNQATETAAIELVDQLTVYNSFSDCEVALSEFSKETNAVFWVEDQNGSVIYPAGISTETEIISGDTAITLSLIHI